MEPPAMTAREDFFKEQKENLIKAIAHLEYSYKKITLLPTDPKELNEETLETWESFSARFSRVADIFLTKYIRSFVLLKDPGFKGSFLDFLNQAEKFHLIKDTETWMGIRELRNISAHEYTDKDLMGFFNRLKQEAPRLLEIKEIL
ncbi:MAG: hypothetical protein A2W47_02465 [Gammaproteobacteria bacterium RIFCSPHIGHO2_12_38_15]|nr:MAG: hypothetical protein A2W47_02465 [Gammaproteobacteria bacterium RIFCSPHIGHO2_12_38_15]